MESSEESSKLQAPRSREAPNPNHSNILRRALGTNLRNNPCMRWQMLDKSVRFPDPRLADEEGLVGVGGDLSVQRLLLAYRSGIFPWTVDPITWWSPDPRAIFELDSFHV